MIYHVVQPWGRDKYRQAGPISSHSTAEEAYAELDRYAARLAEDDLPEDTLELYVVDENREPVPRPGVRLKLAQPRKEAAVQGLRGAGRCRTVPRT